MKEKSQVVGVLRSETRKAHGMTQMILLLPMRFRGGRRQVGTTQNRHEVTRHGTLSRIPFLRRMTKLQLSLTRILGKKELYFGCVLLNVSGIEIKYVIRIDETGGFLTDDGSRQNIETMEIIGHPATLSDFHRWMGELKI